MLPTVGEIPTTSQDILTVPSGMRIIVTKMGFVNRSGADNDITVSVRIKGQTAQIFPTFTLADNQEVIEESEIALGGGDGIIADGEDSGDGTTDVDFHVFGRVL